MIYLFSNTVFVPEKMSEHHEIWAKEGLPLQNKFGFKTVASFHGYTGNINQGFTFYAFDDLAAFQTARQAQQQDKEFQKVLAKVNPLRLSMVQEFLEPNPWSPMK
jgi:hypothetical protein